MSYNNTEKDKAYQKQYREKNRDKLLVYNRNYYKANQEYQRGFDLVRKHGITSSQYDQMWEDQKGLCAICGHPETRTNKGKLVRLSTDHNHATNKVRKLLCSNCNVMIGLANDSIELLQAAIGYLSEEEKK